jgi:hypothetical protein
MSRAVNILSVVAILRPTIVRQGSAGNLERSPTVLPVLPLFFRGCSPEEMVFEETWMAVNDSTEV